MKIKAVLFDLDGTLINTIEDLTDAVNYSLNKAGYPAHTVEECRLMVGNGMRKLIERALPAEKRTDEIIENTKEVFLDYYNKHSVDKTVPYKDLPEAVKELKKLGYKLAVVTNKEENSAKHILQNLYPNAFDIIIGQRDNLPTKPDPAAAHLAMKHLGVTPDECAFIGDSGVDIQTAVNSGATAVGVLWGYRDREELLANGAKFTISSPGELPELIKKIE